MEQTDKSVTVDKSNILLQLPDHIESCRDEIERQIKNSLKDIEENNEIIRGIKQLSRKRKGNSTRMEEVRKQCEDFQQEYEKKCQELRAQTTSNGDGVIQSTDDSNNETIRNEVINKRDVEKKRVQECRKQVGKLKLPYRNKICDYLQEQMNITFSMRYESVRYKELGNIIFCYLMRGEEPNEHVQKIIRRLYEPLYYHIYSENYSWYRLCCTAFNKKPIIGTSRTFAQFYKLLNYNKASLQYLIYKHPQLLLNRTSSNLMCQLIEHSQYATLHEIITNIRDKKGQTGLFYIGWYRQMFFEPYRDHIDDLYELLSIRNSNEQTALHVNACSITRLLADIYTPTQRDSFIKLTSMRDNKNKTALQVHEGDRPSCLCLHSLICRVENNEYITESYINILIMYNTNNRSEAEEEAETIHNACQSKYWKQLITKKKNKTEEEIIALIKQTANKQLFNQSLIVILMSHGSAGTIEDCKGKSTKLSDIEEAMCSDQLNGKPKMLITQCCQIKTEVDEEQKPYVPTHEDFCAVMSTVAGDPSTRGIFLEKLAEQIKKSKRDTNIFKIAQDIVKAMKDEGHKQTPIIMSTLKAGFYPTDDWKKRK